jgi:DNA-binding MarR family transcriptional regulator
MSAEPATTAARRSQVDADTVELVSLIIPSLRALKAAGPPPAEVAAALDRAGLGKRHRPALLIVASTGPISVSDLAKRLGLLVSTTSTIVGQLNRAGLLERAEDDDDRRRHIVYLHEDVRQTIENWLSSALNPVREALERLSPEAREHFMQGWRILHEESIKAAAGGTDHPLSVAPDDGC